MPTIRSKFLTTRVSPEGKPRPEDRLTLAEFLNHLSGLYATRAFAVDMDELRRYVAQSNLYPTKLGRAVQAMKRFTGPGMGTATPDNMDWTNDARLKMVEMYRLKGYSVVSASSTPASTSGTNGPASRVLSAGVGFFASSQTIRRGMCGALVHEWAEVLNWTRGRHGSAFVRDGWTFTVATEAATKAFQRVLGLSADGIVGPQTRAAARRFIEGAGYSISRSAAVTAAPCSPTPASTGGSSSTPPGSGDGTNLPDTNPSGGLGGGGAVGGVLNFFGEYGPVLAVGLGVAAFAMLSTPPSRRR